MAQRRHSMNKISRILQLKSINLSDEQISAALHISKGSVNNIVQKLRQAQLKWPLPEDVPESRLSEVVYGPSVPKKRINEPNYALIYEELHKKGNKRLTLQILFEEYQLSCPDGLGRTAFYDGFRAWRRAVPDLYMHLNHIPGEKLYVDYSGDSLSYYDRHNDKEVKTQLFVASFGASSYTYAEVTHSQNQEDWTMSHQRAFTYFGGLPVAVVPDNLKSAVIKPNLYEPELNALYSSMADHYGVAILPARVARPQDKGVVESNVGSVQQRILMALRNRKFFSLAEINQALRDELSKYNDRPMKGHGGMSRTERFERADKPALRQLPAEPFVLSDIKLKVRVDSNCHAEYKKNYYSVPHQYIGKYVDIHQNDQVLEIYFAGEHLCRHEVLNTLGEYKTEQEHLPPNQQAYERSKLHKWYIARGQDIGPSTAKLFEEIIQSKWHPEQGFKSCQGILTLVKVYSAERVERASYRALFYQGYNLCDMRSILEQGLDKESLHVPKEKENQIVTQIQSNHKNIRGESYYAQNAGGN
jgi:transposase